MAAKSSGSINIENRSPFVVEVRSQPSLTRRFSFCDRVAALRYCDELKAQGIKAKLVQLETSFQLRVRRQGLKIQHIPSIRWDWQSRRFSELRPTFSLFT